MNFLKNVGESVAAALSPLGKWLPLSVDSSVSRTSGWLSGGPAPGILDRGGDCHALATGEHLLAQRDLCHVLHPGAPGSTP